MSGPPSTADNPWPERAETVASPAAVTILGVDRGDGCLAVELPTAVPDEADVLITDRPAGGIDWRERLRGYARNPALLFAPVERAVRIAHDLAVYGTASRDHDRAAVAELAADRDLDVHDLGHYPVPETAEESRYWLAGGWAVTLAVLTGVAAVAAQPHLGTGLFLLACLALAAAYLLARSGVRMAARQERLFEQVRELVSEHGYEHPVLVVSSGQVPGLADHAKEARIRTRARQLSPASEFEE